MEHCGVLMDVNVEGCSVELLFKTGLGKQRACEAFFPYFYATCKEATQAEIVAEMIAQHPQVESAIVMERYARIRSCEKEKVVKVSATKAQAVKKVALDVLTVPGVLSVCELTVPQYFKYMLEKQLDFFAKYRFSTRPDGRLEKIERMPVEELPEFSCAALCQEKKGAFLLETKNGSEPCTLFELPQKLVALDADFLFSFGGDDTLSSTGKFSATPLGCFLAGCIHLDLERDFGHDIYREGAAPVTVRQVMEVGRKRIPRVVELSRASGAKPDLISRITPGRLNTYIHARTAWQKGFLVPDAKSQAERAKSLSQLLAVDRGGLIIYPTPGLYRNVAKCDFASMYPSIMVNYNISPDTLRCSCCKDTEAVPEADWHFCKKRRGIVPTGIEAVLRRRLLLKAMMKKEPDPDRKAELDARQKALKNILVTCFGYLGYSNFVFSNVECKESVMLYGRELLQRAVGIANGLGLEALYGVVDSVFVAGGTGCDYLEYCRRVSREIGITLELDETFAAIAFPESVTAASAANRYYALTQQGKIEARGITIRRKDAFPLAVKFQLDAIPLLLADREWKQSVQQARALLDDTIARLYRGEFEIADLVVTRSVRQSPSDYAVLPDSAKAFWQEPNERFESRFVHTVHGPKPASKARRENVDCRKYKHILRLALEELIRGIGKD